MSMSVRKEEVGSDEVGSDDVFKDAVLVRNIHLPVVCVSRKLKDHLRDVIKNKYEGRCVEEGYVRVDSVKNVVYSSGLIHSLTVEYHVTFECKVCYPVEGMELACYAKDVTKAGVRAEIYPDDSPEDSKPMVLHILRDHHYNKTDINDISKGDRIRVRCIGTRFELNDTFVSVIAEYLGPFVP
jgi:DNA-directed RNA polymerase subunit E'/Rpb7